MTTTDIIDAAEAAGVTARAVYQHNAHKTEMGDEIGLFEVKYHRFKVSCFPPKIQFIAHPIDKYGHAEKTIFVDFSTDRQVDKFYEALGIASPVNERYLVSPDSVFDKMYAEYIYPWSERSQGCLDRNPHWRDSSCKF